MTWVRNKEFEIAVTFWTEAEPDSDYEDEGGLILRDKSDDTTLYVFIIQNDSSFVYEDDGRFIENYLQFQISRKELDDNDFEIIIGRTCLEYQGYTYRIVHMDDMRQYVITQLIDCKAVRMIDAY